MGRRSRTRHDVSGRSASRAPATRRRDRAPTPPWGAFPLVELAVLAAIALGIAGFVVGGGTGGVLLVGAILIGSAAGLEVAVREHLAGYRSHTLVLSGSVAVATMIALTLLRVDREVTLPVALAVLVVAFVALRELFKRRSGGLGVKVR